MPRDPGDGCRTLGARPCVVSGWRARRWSACSGPPAVVRLTGSASNCRGADRCAPADVDRGPRRCPGPPRRDSGLRRALCACPSGYVASDRPCALGLWPGCHAPDGHGVQTAARRRGGPGVSGIRRRRPPKGAPLPAHRLARRVRRARMGPSTGAARRWGHPGGCAGSPSSPRPRAWSST